MKTKEKSLPAGTTILCGHCKAELYKTKKDFVSGGIMLACDFLPFNQTIPQPKDGQEALCFFCGKDFTRGFTRDFMEVEMQGISMGVVSGLLTPDGWFNFS